MRKKKLQWHTAFQAVMQIEFEEDQEYLQFLTEYNLTSKPLQIDVLIIKLVPGKKLRKSLGKLFRRYNIVEYKSPDDYLSVNDFFKVLAYACLYQANTGREQEIPPEELTITLISNRYPRTLIRFLRKQFGVAIEEVYSGIYYITGLLFPVQIVIIGKLTPEENLWLSRLRRNLKTREDIEPLAKAYQGKEQHPLYSAAMDLIVRANQEQYKEDKNMCDALRELFADELVEREQQGKLLTLISQVCKKLQKGQPIDMIADALETDVLQIAPIIEAAKTCMPGYDPEKIYQALTKSTK